MESSSWPWQHLGTFAFLNQASFASFDWLLIILLIAALFGAASASAAETALTSVSRIKIRNQAEEGDLRARRILRMLENPQDFLSTILVVSNVSVIVASTVSTILAINLFVQFGEIISTVVLSFIVLVFCEITPKTIAIQAPEAWAKRLARPVEGLSRVMHPVIVALTFITRGLVRVIGGRTVRRGPFVTEEELRLLVEVGEEEGVLEEEEREMIHNVFELADTSVREIMVPRIDMVTIEGDAGVEEAMDLIVQGGQSRIPVYDGSIDNIIGVLYAKDLLRIQRAHQQPDQVSELVRPAYFVPESKHLDDLLRELQQQHVHMAIVVDEYGSVSGLVTIEDLVEEIIGDIQDEYDREEQLLEQISPDEYLVNAKISLDELNEELDTKLTSEDYDTLGGFVYGHLDKIPTVGDEVEAGGFTMTVMSTRGRRVTKVRLLRQRPRPPAGRQDEKGDQPASSTPSSPIASAASPSILPSSVGGEGQAPDRLASLSDTPSVPSVPSAPQVPETAADQGSNGSQLPSPQAAAQHSMYVDREETGNEGEADPADGSRSESLGDGDGDGPVNNFSRPLRARYSNTRRGSHNHHSSQPRRRP
jgi:CBS domain containing-hemolysin-like protein